jgi:hypothetical protein
MADKSDMTGVWYGRYRSQTDLQDNSFIAVLEDQGGAFDGSISEPDDRGGSGIRQAVVEGERTGATLHFVKQYTGRWTHAVHYSGRIDAEGTVITGTWVVDWVRGTFTMQREKFDAEELEDEEEIELETPLAR